MLYYNIHSHQTGIPAPPGTIINIVSSTECIPADGCYAAGLHPWRLYIKTVKLEWESLRVNSGKPNVLAIGECGLDKVCKTDWKLQEEWFARQIELANLVNKPLIIHCVRAFEEVLLMLKKSKVNVPVIFHGFNKSAELARKILAEGYYLSFGKHLIDNSSVRKVFAVTPADKLFLETDAAEIDIGEVYSAAAGAKGMDLQTLAGQIEKNIIKVFGEKMTSDDE